MVNINHFKVGLRDWTIAQIYSFTRGVPAFRWHVKPVPPEELAGETQFVGGDTKYCRVDLWKEGMTPIVMETMLPFQINCSQMYSGERDLEPHRLRPNHRCLFVWEILLLSPQDEVIAMYKPPEIHFALSSEWKTADYTFHFKTGDAKLLKQFGLRYVVFIHAG